MRVPSIEVPLALYVHMPWCVRKCPYCDFNSHALPANGLDESYTQALIEDFERELPLLGSRRIDTVFFGGGTPSLFPPKAFEQLLRAFRARAQLAADAEVTMEVNPGAIEHGAFAEYRDAGINRISLGAQSFDAKSLHRLGRIHTPEDTLRAVEELDHAGLHNFNVDLMYALPEQSVEQALDDVQRACSLGAAHISHYQLTLEPGTAFHSRPPALPDEDNAWRMQVECQALLASRGYSQYEVSAYARPGSRCRHNLNYWEFGDYAGIGAGAHGKLSLQLPGGVLRTVKPNSPRQYRELMALSECAFGERKSVDESELPFEFMLNTLRLNEGFSVQGFEARTGLTFAAVEQRVARCEGSGWLTQTDAGWRATALGLRFLNDVNGAFLD